MKRLFILLTLLTAFIAGGTAQILKPVKWQISSKKVSPGVYDIVCKATIDDTWHLYDAALPEGGPVSTTFNIDEEESTGVETTGTFKATGKALSEHSTAFNMELRYFENSVVFIQRVKLTKEKGKLTGYVEFMACSGGTCIPPAEAEFNFELSK